MTQERAVTRKPSITIKPSPRWVPLNLAEVWEYRSLLVFLAWRDVSVRYKQTALGVAWAVIQPLLTMIVFSVFFGRLIKVPSDGVPYPVFSYAALLPWQYFSTALASASQSLITDEKLVTKIYFPRLIIPLASIIPPVVDFGAAFVILIGLMIFYGIPVTGRLLLLPVLMVLAATAALGLGLWLSATNVRYRDFRYVVPFVIQFWLFVSPVAYPSSVVPEQWRLIFGLNPMTGVIEGFRWALLSTDTAPGPLILVSALISLLTLVSGAYYFRNMERSFSDII
jgi:lipopolysaccharide transport system permease protein